MSMTCWAFYSKKRHPYGFDGFEAEIALSAGGDAQMVGGASSQLPPLPITTRLLEPVTDSYVRRNILSFINSWKVFNHVYYNTDYA